MPLAKDLLYPDRAEQIKTNKRRRLVPHPNSYFMDVKCPTCFEIRILFSHSQRVVRCLRCNEALCQPTGGKARLVEGCAFRRKTA